MKIPAELIKVIEKISIKEWIDIEKILKDQSERIKICKQISRVIDEVKRKSGDDSKISDLKKKFNIK